MGPCLNVCLPGFSGTDGRYFWLHEILGKLSCVYAIPETHRHEQYCLRNLWGSVHTSIVASQLVPDVPAKRLQKFPGARARSCRFSGPDRMRASNLTHKVFGFADAMLADEALRLALLSSQSVMDLLPVLQGLARNSANALRSQISSRFPAQDEADLDDNDR